MSTVAWGDQVFRSFFETNQDGIAFVDMDGRITKVNPAFESMVGYTCSELLQMSFLDLTPSQWHEAERDLLENIVRVRGNSDPYEKEYRRKDGHIFPVSLHTWLLKDPEGKPLGYWAVVRDITEQKRTEEALLNHQNHLEALVEARVKELQRVNQDLQAEIRERQRAEAESRQLRQALARVNRLSTMGVLVAMLAHDINQPLTAIQANALAALKLLESERIRSGDLRAILEDISADGLRAGKIIHALRSSISQDQNLGQELTLDVNGLVRQVSRILEGELRQEDIAVLQDLDPDLPIIRADPVQMQQVLLNLMNNAVEALREKPQGSRRILLRTMRKEQTWLCLEVLDNGVGFRHSDLKKLFQPFRSTKNQGLGLGLAICRFLVEQQEGSIQAENLSEGGAHILIRLPIPEDKLS